jgi:exodeoxyribonuclease V gamma subunit
LLHFRPSEFKGKDKIQLWINHLALCADKSLSPQPSRFVGKKAEYQLQPLDADLAREKLQTLLEIYRQGQQQALLFIPETSYAAYNPDYATEDKRLQAINKAWQGNRFPAIPGEGSNLYVDRCFGESEEWPAEFFELAEQVFSGFHELLEERDLEQGK